jgi:hypothetical protein
MRADGKRPALKSLSCGGVALDVEGREAWRIDQLAEPPPKRPPAAPGAPDLDR